MGVWGVGLVSPSLHFLFLSEEAFSNLWGKKNSPGRFHAALIMKIILAHIVSHYELTLESKGRTKFMWESFTLPYDSTRVSLKKIN
jgi:hypothetical protein